jgi:phage terminase large subunit GpA-like protein
MIINPDKVDVITDKNRKQMVKDILEEIKKFPKTNVSENLVEFAERKRKLVSGSSARPGPYRFDVTPFWREPSLHMSENSKATEVIIMKSTQTGGTELLLNHTLYCMNYGIGPVCYVSSDEGLAVKHSETRIGPMLQAAGMSDIVQAPVKSKANKGTGDKVNLKFYKGTFIQLIGARSESKASSTPIRIVHYDEVDKYPLQLANGGNPIIKIRRRTDSYGNLRKELFVSTPKRKANSVIEPLFEQGNMCYYHVECPECGDLHRLEFSRLKWDKDDKGNVLLEYDENDNLINDPVWHECPHCSYKMRSHEKLKAMQEFGHGGNAKWIPTKKPDRPGIKSYHVNGLYGFRTFLDIVIEFQAAKDDIILLEDFICDTLGETWSQKIDKPDEHYLQSRAETDWERGQIPDNVKVLTVGADIHPDRIEYQIIGFGRRKESWSIDYDSLAGDIYDPNDLAWDKFEEILRAEYFQINGDPIPLHIAILDAQGKASEVVKNFCSRFPYSEGSINGVYPSLGKTNVPGVVKEVPSSIDTPEILLSDQQLKFEIYNNLKKKKPAIGEKYPSGYVHFHSDYHSDYFKQLTAEEIEEIQNTKGTFTETFITNKKGRRNEALDTFKMALAGLYYMNVKYFKMLNKRQKSRKKKEITPSWDLFFNLFGSDIED